MLLLLCCYCLVSLCCMLPLFGVFLLRVAAALVRIHVAAVCVSRKASRRNKKVEKEGKEKQK